MRFEPETDKELWLLTDGKSTLPFIATRGGIHEGKIRSIAWATVPAFPLDGPQLSWVHSIINKLAILVRDSLWVFRDGDFTVLFRKAPGITPDYYTRWGDSANNGKPVPVVSQINDPEEPKNDSVDLAFIKRACRMAGLNSVSLAQLHWIAFCRAMMVWMIEEKKPVNLGFATLNAFPFRANWQHILAAKIPTLGVCLSYHPSQRSTALGVVQFDNNIKSPTLIELSKDREFAWNLDITPNEKWKQYSHEYERSALLENSPASYTARWFDLVTKARSRIIASLSAWFSSTCLPAAKLDKCGPKSDRHFIPSRLGTVRHNEPVPPCAAVYPAKPKDEEDEEDSAYDAEAPDLFAVPDGKLTVDNVWGNRRMD